jgi:hypothetical protein
MNAPGSYLAPIASLHNFMVRFFLPGYEIDENGFDYEVSRLIVV